MNLARQVFDKLVNEFGFRNSTGEITFTLRDISITVNQNNVVGNILEEWFAQWLIKNEIPHIYNNGQSSPDFWLNPRDLSSDWLELKSFTGNPNFDVGPFNSFITTIINTPCKLQANYLIIKYRMSSGILTIENCWLKKLWELCGPSNKWPVKLQEKQNVLFNIRPVTWYSDKAEYPNFKCLEDFLSALEEVIYTYSETHHKGTTWQKEVVASYRKHYNVELHIPRWMDIKDKYTKLK